MRTILLALIASALLAGDAAWADRSGRDAAGSWAEIDVAGTALRLRWRTFAQGEQAWLGEAPVPPQVVQALIPDIPDARSLRWRGEQGIADAQAICALIESARPRMRCLLPRLTWLREAFPEPVPGWPRLWSGDLMQGWVPYMPIMGTRLDDVLASRLWGPPWSTAELVEPPFPPRDPARDEFGEEDRYTFLIGEEDPPSWVRPIDRIGRGNDGSTPLAALRRVRKDGEAYAAGEPEGAALGFILAAVDVRGAGEVQRTASADAAAPRALTAPGHADGFGAAVSVSPDGMRAATASADGVRLWDLGRGLAIGTLRRADGLPMLGDLMTWSADGARLFTAAEDGHLACWDAASAALVWRSTVDVDDGRWTGHMVGVAQNATRNVSLGLPGDGRLLRVAQVMGSDDGGNSWNIWYDAATGAPVDAPVRWTVEQGTREVNADMRLHCTIKRVSDGRVLDAAWDVVPIVVEEAGMVAVCDGRTLRRWRLPDVMPLREIALPDGAWPRSDALLTALDPDGVRWLFHDGIAQACVIDTATGLVRAEALGEGTLMRMAGGRFVLQSDIPEVAALEGLMPGIQLDIAGMLPAARGRGLVLAGGDGPLLLRDGNRILAEIPIRALELRGIAFAADGLVISGVQHSWRIDLATLRTSIADPLGDDPGAFHAMPACPGADGGTWTVHADGAWELTGADGAVRRRLPPDPLRRAGGSPQRACAAVGDVFVVSDGVRILCRADDGALRWWTDAGDPPESPVSRLAISSDGRLIASMGETVALWRAADGALLCRFALSPGGPIAVTPDGFYAVRGDPGPFVSFRWDGETWPVTEFDLQRNRPDLVAAAIGLADGETIAALRRAWEGRCRRLGVSPGVAMQVGRLPRARIDRTALPLAVDGATLDLPLTIDPVPAGSVLMLRLDDVPIPSRAGTPIGGTGERRSIALVPGINRIAVSVRLPDGREGLRDTAWVVSRAVAAPAKLHLLAVGCSRYRHPGLDLDYAAKDARDLAAGLAPATAVVVTDADATRAGIMHASERLRHAAPHDVVAVFLAGHGVLDEAGNYWFLTHDADPQRPDERALAYAAIEDLLESCPSRRRVVLLDTCHAGELDGEGLAAVAAPAGSAAGVRARGLRAWKASARRPGFEFLDLRSGVGAAVLASSAGLEFAFESPEWSNGVFTMAVLEGWARGRADGDGDGSVRVGELSAFVSGRVSALTAGAQNPAVRSANRSVDVTLVRP